MPKGVVMKRFSSSVFVFLSMAAVAAPAAAQRVDEIIAFGDSYADEGNAFELGLVRPELKPLYPTGRFTGGTNYVDTLSQLLDAPVANFAVGGARANPDFLAEIGAFVSGGGGVFPTVTPLLDEGDLVTVSIGGNDARAYGSTPGATVGEAAAAAAPAIGATAAGLDVLVAAGAPTISFLAGDTGQLPEVANNPSAAALRTAYSTAFNQGMQQVLAEYAADGVIVHYLDLSGVLAQVQANPAAYGITGITCPAFPDPTCLINGGAGFLIYGDLLHPTSQGSAIIARYIAAQLKAPLVLQAPSDLGLDTARQFGRTLSFRTDVNGRTAAPGLRGFVIGDYFSRDIGRSQTNDPFDVDGAGVTAGLEFGLHSGVIGVAANYSRPRVRFGNDAFRENARSYQIGAFGGFSMGAAFVQAHVAYGSDRHRLNRTGVIDNMTARPDGSHVVAGAKAGYMMSLGAVGIGPVAGLEYARAKVDAYTEEGDAALTLNVSEQSLQALTGTFGIEVRPAIASPIAGVRPFASALLEKDFTGDSRTVVFSQTSAPVIVNQFDIEDRSTEIHGRLSAGGSAIILNGIAVEAAASTTVGKDQGNELSAHVGVSLGF